MNFETFTSRVTASAALVTDAARSFNNFDEMASQDEYIHSPDLKISQRPSSHPQNQEGQQTVITNEGNNKNYMNSGTGLQQQELETSVSRSSSVADELYQQRLEESTAAVALKTQQEETSIDDYNYDQESNDTHQQHQHQSLSQTASTHIVLSQTNNEFRTTHSLPEEYEYSARRPGADIFAIPRAPPNRQTTMPLLSVVSDLVKDSTTQTKRETNSKKENDIVVQSFNNPTRSSDKWKTQSSITSSRQSSRHSATSTNTPTISSDNTSDSDDDSDIDEYDPVMDMIKAQRKPAAKKSASAKAVVDNGEGSKALEEKAMDEISKNPNRFNEGLEYRMSLPEQPPPPPAKLETDEEIGISSQPLRSLERASSSFTESKNKWEWVKTMTSSKVNQILSGGEGATATSGQREMTPLTAHLSRHNKNVNEESDPNENFQLVVSSSILGADEQAELDRLRQASVSSADPFSTALKYVEKKPQFVAAGFVFFLVVAMYFWMGERVVKAESELN